MYYNFVKKGTNILDLKEKYGKKYRLQKKIQNIIEILFIRKPPEII